jgi:hypothetical protein
VKFAEDKQICGILIEFVNISVAREKRECAESELKETRMQKMLPLTLYQVESTESN